MSSILLMGFGPWQVILIIIVVVLLFGGKKIPELARGLGQGIKEFQDAMNTPPTPPPPDKDKTPEQPEDKK